jgi:hypothetical protein
MKQRKTDQSITAVPSARPSIAVNAEDSLNAADSWSASSDCWSQFRMKYFKKNYKWLVKNKYYFDMMAESKNYGARRNIRFYVTAP